MPKPTTISSRIFYPGLIAIYLILLAFNGYLFGENDHAEVLPYALHLADDSLYVNDFYIQNIHQSIPNERYIFSKLLSLAGSYIELACAFFHLLCSLSIIAGLFKIARLFLQLDITAWFVILLVNVWPLYFLNLGGNELYYNFFTSGLLAKSIGVWVIFYFLKENYKWFLVLLIITVFAHPLVGAQLALLCFGSIFLGKLWAKINVDWKHFMIMCFSFFLTGGVWIVLLKLNYDQGTVSNQYYFDFIEFRAPHHYIPSSFPLKNYMLLVPLFFLGLGVFYKIEKKLFLFFLLSIIGLIFYSFGTEVLHNPSIISLQWFKTTIWLKAFSVMALLYLLEQRLPIDKLKEYRSLIRIALTIAGVVAILVMSFPFLFFKNKPYQFFFAERENAAIDIALQAKNKTPQDAVFVTPFSNTSFKFYSQRSAYINYKTVAHRKDVLAQQYERLKSIYNIDVNTRRRGEDITQIANSFYESKKETDWLALRSKGVEYILTSKAHQLSFPVIAQNNDFLIYKIEK